MKFKVLPIILMCAFPLLLSSCAEDGSTSSSSSSSEQSSSSENTSGSSSSLKVIQEYVVIDGILYVTYKDDPTTKVPIGKFEEEPATEGLDYRLQEDGTYWVACGNASSIRNVVVPSVHNGRLVTGIDTHGFLNNYSMETISLPKTLKYVGSRAFTYCSALKEIEFPEGLTYLDSAAVFYCPQLYRMVIPSTVENNPNGILELCLSFVELVNKTSFEVTSFDKYSTRTQFPIKHVISDPSSTYIVKRGEYVFYEEPGERPILVSYSGHNSTMNLNFDFQYDINSSFMNACKFITEITTNNNLIVVGDYAFQDCTAVTSITLFNSITNFERYAFWGCLNSTIYFEGTSSEWEAIPKGTNACYYNTDRLIPVVFSN